MAETLVVTPRARARLWRLARAAAPEEACGLLVGRRGAGPGDPDRVEAVVAVRNIALDRRRTFRLDPGGWVRGEGHARAAGRSVLGIWHSHPAGGPPSSLDLAGAPAGLWSLVVALGGDFRAELYGWRPGGTVPFRVPTERDDAPLTSLGQSFGGSSAPSGPSLSPSTR